MDDGMTGDRQQKVRARAHALWLEAGQPDGKAQAHWAQAEQEITADRGAVADATDYAMQTDKGTLNQDAEPIAASKKRKARDAS